MSVILFDYPLNKGVLYAFKRGWQDRLGHDILFPGIGRIVSGSQREERLGILAGED